MTTHCFSVSSARVDMTIQINATWQDAFQFTAPTGTTWDFTSKTFEMDIKASSDDTTALLRLTTGNGRIVVDDAANRILYFNVAPSVLATALVPGDYVYDLLMLDGSSPAVVTALMHGKVCVGEGDTAP